MEKEEIKDIGQIETIECSAPSKVLITGCYLIIEPYYNGLVLSCSARLKTTLKINKEGDIKNGETTIKCHSPQMGDKSWIFTLRNTEADGRNNYSVELEEEKSNDGFEFSRAILNSFFSLLPFSKTLNHESIQKFSTFLDTVSSLDFTFIGDNSLYSFEPESSKGDEEKKDKQLAKTGMGSSATFISKYPISYTFSILYCHFVLTCQWISFFNRRAAKGSAYLSSNR